MPEMLARYEFKYLIDGIELATSINMKPAPSAPKYPSHANQPGARTPPWARPLPAA